MCKKCKSEPKPEDLGIDLENGTVDGEYVGKYMARIAFRLRKRNAKHYLHRKKFPFKIRVFYLPQKLS